MTYFQCQVWYPLLKGLCGETQGPNTDPLLQSEDLTEAVQRLQVYLRSLPLGQRLALGFGAAWIAWGLWPLAPKWLTLTRLHETECQRYLESWQNSPYYHRQLIFRAVKSILLIQLYSSPRILARMKYTGRRDCQV